MMRFTENITIETQDVGGTQEATVWFGETEVCAFRTHTRHDDVSMKVAEELVARALRSLIGDEIAREEYSKGYYRKK